MQIVTGVGCVLFVTLGEKNRMGEIVHRAIEKWEQKWWGFHNVPLCGQRGWNVLLTNTSHITCKKCLKIRANNMRLKPTKSTEEPL